MRSLALFSALAVASAASPPLSWTVLPQPFADTFGAACLDGTPPGFYGLVQDPTKVIIFLEGGGWCFDTTTNGTIANCAGRATGGGGSSKYNGATMDVGGMLSSDPLNNIYFSNFSLFFVHYCDGTSFSSAAINPVPVSEEIRAHVLATEGVEAPSEIYFRGRANLLAVLSYLRTQTGLNHDPTDIVLSGGSAGATAAYLALDVVASVFPKSNTYGAPDAGYFADAFNVADNMYWYRTCFQAADPIWNTTASGGVNANCLQAFPPSSGLSWKCFLPQYHSVYIETPYMILNSAYDQWMILNDLSLGCVPSQNGQPVAGVPTCSASQLEVMQQFRGHVLQNIAPALTLPGTGAFVTSCFVHEQNVDYCSSQSLPNCIGWNIYNVSIPNATVAVTMDTAFHQWYLTVSGSTEKYQSIVSARKEIIRGIALPAALQGEDAAQVLLMRKNAAEKKNVQNYYIPETVYDLEAGVVQIIDPVTYPNNPSCPFPTPAAQPPRK